MFSPESLHFGYFVYGRVAESQKTLKRLKIGFENQALLAYEQNRMQDHEAQDSDVAVSSKNFIEEMEQWLEQWPSSEGDSEEITLQLESLSLRAFDMRAITNYEAGAFLNFGSLTSLSLESCPGLEETLRVWTEASESSAKRRDVPNLRLLTVRNEWPGPQLQTELEKFICSLSELQTLYILIEGVDNYNLNLKNILDTHGPTLRHLIWDLRKDSNSANGRGASDCRDLNRSLDIIADKCPNLRELGSAVSWNRLQKFGADGIPVGTSVEEFFTGFKG